MTEDGEGNLQRFSGFADLYDTVRPSAPADLAPLLCAYSGSERPAVVDLGSGSGLSSRWASTWAASVTGIEPSDDMRRVAESRPVAGVEYRKGVAHDTGLPDGSADVVLAVQALHWMDPMSTMVEVGRVLRPGGVFAAADADWPPVAGRSGAERAWTDLDRRFRVYEDRLRSSTALRAPIDERCLAHGTGDADDPVASRDRPAGVRSWDKRGHLARMAASGQFAFTCEIALHQMEPGGEDRFVALMRSQGTYQQLRRLGLSDAELGVDRFESAVHDAYIRPARPDALVFSWRVRLGVMAGEG